MICTAHIFSLNVICILMSVPYDICGLVCRNQVSRARISNYIPQILWDVITYACTWYLLMTQCLWHYIDVIMTTMASQITSLTVVCSTVYSDADQRKHQSSAPLAFVWGIHRDRWIPRTKGQLRGKCFHLMTSSWDVITSPCPRYMLLVHKSSSVLCSMNRLVLQRCSL